MKTFSGFSGCAGGIGGAQRCEHVGSAAAEQMGSTISFGRQGEYHGYFVPGNDGEKLPGIVMIHEWWGLNSNIKAEADKYARRGYNVLAVDLFGKVATTPEEAMKLVQGVDQQAATAQLLAAADYLRALPTPMAGWAVLAGVSAGRIAHPGTAMTPGSMRR